MTFHKMLIHFRKTLVWNCVMILHKNQHISLHAELKYVYLKVMFVILTQFSRSMEKRHHYFIIYKQRILIWPCVWIFDTKLNMKIGYNIIGHTYPFYVITYFVKWVLIPIEPFFWVIPSIYYIVSYCSCSM